MKIICIGRNYANHAKELKNDLPTEPVIFLKPDTALLKDNGDFYLPSFSNNIHYELELIVKINKNGKKIDEKFAHKYFDEISVGIDFTARDKQDELKQKSLPWELAKAFDNSAVIGNFIPKNEFEDLQNIQISMQKNNKLVQQGNTKDMLFNIPKIISFVSQFITLRPGDIIFTGTPEGVGKVEIGDMLTGFIEDKKLFECRIK